jgi:hypothetical protein
MSVEIEAYAVISAIDLLLIVSGAILAIAGHHALMQWRLNRPQQPAQKTP